MNIGAGDAAVAHIPDDGHPQAFQRRTLCDAFFVAALAPSPNDQVHAATDPSASVLASVNVHASALHEYVNAAVGGVFAGPVTVTSRVLAISAPSSSTTVCMTKYSPGAA
jgi:hypothetical protein